MTNRAEQAERLCGAFVVDLIAGATWVPCALANGHEGGHRGKGSCMKHGDYFGDAGSFPRCPQCPTCLQRPLPSPEERPTVVRRDNTDEWEERQDALRKPSGQEETSAGAWPEVAKEFALPVLTDATQGSP